MGSLATREAPGGSSRDQGGPEQKFVGWFLSVCELRRFGPVAGWRESNAAHTAGRPVPPRAAEARPHAPESGARLLMSTNIFISVTPILPACFVGAEEMCSRSRSASLKLTGLLVEPQPWPWSPIKHTSMVSKRALSVATEAYVCELERRAPTLG